MAIFNRAIKGRGVVALALCALLLLAGTSAAAPTVPATAPAPSLASAADDFGFAEPFFEAAGDAESITYGIVTALAQDANGWLWIGTQYGLLRYDGYRFRKFKHDNADPTSLAGDYVTALWAGHDGRLWVGTNSDGLSVFEPGTERFSNLGGGPARPDASAAASPGAIAGGRVWALAGDASGGVWVGANEGLDYWPAGASAPQRFRHERANPASLADDRVRSLLVDRHGTLWVGGTDGLQRRKPGGKEFERVASDRGVSDRGAPDRGASDRGAPARVVSAPIDPDSLAGQPIMALFEAADGKLWIGTREQGAAWLDPGALGRQPPGRQSHRRLLHRLTPDPLLPGHLSHGWVDKIVQAQPDRIWLGTVGGGVNIVNASNGAVLRHLRHDPSNPGSLALNDIGALLAERSGLLWVGSWGGGLQRHNPANQAFRLLRHSPARPAGLSHPDVRSVLESDDGRILVGSDGNGIDILDRRRGLVGGHRPQPGQAGALGDGAILALATARDGALWAGTQQAGAFRLAPGAGAWQGYSTGQGLPAAQASKFLVARDGTLWAATGGGAARWLPAQQRFEAIAQAGGGAMRAGVAALAEDARGRLWFASNAGLWVKEPGAAGLNAILHDPQRPDSLASNDVSGLLSDSKGRLWVATSKGLERLKSWDGTRAVFEHVSALAGKPGKYLGGNLLEDKLGRIWASEFVLDPDTMHLVELVKADGFDIGTSWNASYASTRDGLFLYGGTQGIVVIDPARFQPWAFQPGVRASELAVDGKPLPLGALTPSLTLEPGKRGFAVGFAALDYSAPQKNRYSYRLQDYDQEWIDTDAEHRSASYGNLWPGNYTLQVRGSNRLGEWSAQWLSIPVVILPALWQTPWFLGLTLLVLSATAYGGYRWRVGALQARARALQDMVAERTADILNLGKIGQDLTATLNTEDAFERVHRQVRARLDAHVFSIGLYDEANEHILFVYEIDDGQRQAVSTVGMDELDRPAVWCVRERRELVTATRAGLLDFVSTVLPSDSGTATETMVYLPLMVEQQVIGCLSAQSPRPHAYGTDQLEFLHVLASYTAIALSNSAAHGQLEEAHDELAAAHGQLGEAHGELAAAHGQLGEAHDELAAAHGQLGEAHDELAAAHDGLEAAHGALEASHLRLKETQQQLVQQGKMAGLGTLTAGVAHEINNPTNFAHVGAQILRASIADFEQFVFGLFEDDAPPETVQAFAQRFAGLLDSVDTVLSGTTRIKGIVKDLRSFTRLDEADTKAVRLSECLTSTLNLVRNSWLEQVEFVTEFADDPKIECWPALLNQVFMNLLVNSCHAIAEKRARSESDARGRLWLRLRLEERMLVIEFEDEGIGIPLAIQARIMEPFFTTKEVGSGTGLGLSIAFGIVQKHGGTLDFTSNPGVGTCFTLRLPLIK